MTFEIEDSDFFRNQFKEKRFDKNQIITDFGQVEDYLYFLKKGIVRFIVLMEEKEVTIDFAFEGEFFSAYSSFLTREPTKSAIITITATACYRISYSRLQKVYVEVEESEKIGRLAAEKLFVKKTTREMDLLTLNPEEKYKKLLANHPHFIKYIPLKYIASYLGMSPETLSRVRSSIS
jgi:CRP-like cAMP-binding protein